MNAGRTAILTCVAAFLGGAPGGCTFDPTAAAPIPVLQSLYIRDPVPAGTNCVQRARAAMWLLHNYDAEVWPVIPVLPASTTPEVTATDGGACEHVGVIVVRVSSYAPTVPWFVLAMNESDWITECNTPLLRQAGPGASLAAVGAIRFVRGASGCTIGGP